MCYCKHTKYAKFKNEIQNWYDGYESYLNNSNWDYNFESEYSQGDCEQSILSQLIFIKLFEKLFINSSSKLKDKRTISITLNNFKDKECFFLFDVMHNPKSGQPYNNAQKKNINLDFFNIYHTIGNFAPIPSSIISHNYGPNLQKIHYDLNELWPWFLKFLKDNWTEFPTKIIEFMTFEEYMDYTCQKMYFSRIFNKFYAIYNETIYSSYYENVNLDSLWEPLLEQLSIEKIEPSDILITFNELFEDQNLEEINKQIRFLIEFRGRYIIYILKANQ